MAEIVNLRSVRKARKRAEAAQAAAENRARFGESSAVRKLRSREAERVQDQLDGARLDSARPDSAPSDPKD